MALVMLALVGCLSTADPGALVPPTADQDPHLPQVDLTVAGHTRAVHLETVGDPANPALLVLHGSLSDYRAMRALDPLSDRYFLVYWDQRGNGLSERIPADEISPEAVVEEIDAIKAMFSPESAVTLVGHSFGAMYSALYASRRPDAVRQVVLAEPGGLNSAVFEATYSDVVNIDLLSEGMTDRMWQNRTLSADEHAEMDYKALLVLLDGEQMNYWCDPEDPPEWPLWRPGAYLEARRSVEMLREGFDFAAGLDEWAVPTLILGTDCSAIGYDYQLQHTAPLFADAEVVLVPDAGHRLIVEQPDLVLDAITAYLDEYEEEGRRSP